jgi:hypothetical protein
MKGMKVSDSPSPRRHSRRALVFRLLRRSRLLALLGGLAEQAQLGRGGGDDAVDVVEAPLVVGHHGERVAQVFAEGVVARPGRLQLRLAMVGAERDAQLVQLLHQRLAQDDVDGAGHRARTGLGGGRALDLDALDLVGSDLVDREARRHALTVDQQLREAAAHAAHADLAAATRPSAGRDAGQAAHQIGEVAVAEAQQVVAADDDLARRGGAAAVLVAVLARDLDLVELGLGRRGGSGQRGRCGGRGGRGLVERVEVHARRAAAIRRSHSG